MREDFLHHLWKYRNISSHIHYTKTGQRIEIIHPGVHNYDAGPDFFNARIRIDDLEWAGNVEIHVKSSDWVLHGHSSNRAYDNVILHVVYEDDKPVKVNGSTIPTLQLKGCINVSSIEKFEELSATNTFIPCESVLQGEKLDQLQINNYMSRLFVEKLEGKSAIIMNFMHANKGDWDETYYQILARAFGQGKNRTPFELLAKSLPLKILKNEGSNLSAIEALFFGQAGFLNNQPQDFYTEGLTNNYRFLKSKYKLEPIDEHIWKYSRLRPGNFPTLRIAQLAKLCAENIINMKSLLSMINTDKIHQLFNVQASSYWETHSKFGKRSKLQSPKLGHASVNGIVINAIAPTLLEYARINEDMVLRERAIELVERIPGENNNIISRWKRLGISVESAVQSQALLHLKTAYCDSKKCLSCTIGTALLKH